MSRAAESVNLGIRVRVGMGVGGKTRDAAVRVHEAIGERIEIEVAEGIEMM